ncbi:MAG: lamin tail domain-containing protein [Opitutaceae bacterium]
MKTTPNFPTNTVFAILTSIIFAASSSAQVVISEFMAKNDETLIDGDGNYSDWIELYNTGAQAVDLTGWYLSDDTVELNQWAFPSTSIAAGEHLVVFASGQDAAGYTDSLGYLHTNFKLSGSGESVVLTQSDGTTIEHSFVDYPEQDDDVSYGLAQDSSYTSLIVEEQDATAIAGTSEPSATWNTPSFNDGSWQSGTIGVGFEDVEDTWTGGGRPPRGWEPESPTYDDLISLEISGMLNQTASAYIRVAFTLDGTEDISQLALRMKYDDGFVAYINGTEVASANAPASPTHTSSATAEHDGTVYEDFTISGAGAFLQSGENVLAIHGLNEAGDTTDFFISPLLTGITVGELQTNEEMYYSTATPGTDNVSGVLGYVDDTTFTVDRGFFSTAFAVEIACDTVGSSIYYTVDGTTPATDNGTLYTGAITIDKTTVLRAAAFLTGYQSSDVDTQTYIFLDDVITQGTSVGSLAPEFPASAVNGQDFDYGMDTDITQSATYSSQIEAAMTAIPSISIVTDPDNLFDASTGIYVNASESGEAWEREMSVELINPDGSDGFQINGGMRIRGASSTTSSNPKHSFRFMFKSEYGTSKLNYPLFGDEGADSYKRMDLRTGQNFSWANQTPAYATWLYDIFTRDTHRDMNQPYTRGEYYHLYINGMYWGLYQTEERCDSRYAASYYGGDKDDYDAVKADADSGDMYALDGTRDAYEDLWTGITAGVSGNSNYFALQGMNSDGTENSAGTKLLDVDNVIDYMLLIYFTGNRDSPVGPPIGTPTMPRNLTTIYNRENPDGFKYVAHDNEHSLEVSQGVNYNRFNQSLISSFDGIDRMTPWWMNLELMANDEYALRFADRVHEHFFNGGELTTAQTTARMETRRDEIYAAVVAESARWGDSAGTLRTRDGDWEGTVDWLLDTYMAQRSAIVLAQIQSKGWYPSVAAPEFNQHGGSIASGFSLSISGSGTVYYTTDGSDPREVGGTVSGTAYSSALTLNTSTQIKARVLSGGTWSALTKATFILNESSPLRVTEIMYHPADAGTVGETGYEASDFEYIEILNTSDEAVGLPGIEFSSGIRFEFIEGAISTLDSGEYAILVSNLDAFKARYADWATMNIIGQYHGKFYIDNGSLANSGEGITLIDGLGNTILDFEYNDSWYGITDGEGYSLTLIDPTADTTTWSDSISWRASAYIGGTPGAAAVDFWSPNDIVINEALTHQDDDTPGDWVELYNTSTETIDINGWFLSDDGDDLAKIELSGLSSIAPGGYLVLTEASHFGTTVDAVNGFALSELGEAIYLSSGESGELTGYRVADYFGAAERDVTFGRYVTNDGIADFTAQSSQTSGAENADPLIGDVVITEIMYHPTDVSSGYEFIEICNTGSSSAALYHASYPTSTWKLEGAVEFTFPTGLTLDSGEVLLITETDETTFRAYYPTLDAGVTVLGPYTGALDNAGEDVYLTRPGDPEALTGEVPYIVVEFVDYDDESPWASSADGLGASLERIDATSYPNDSTNWAANESPSTGTFVIVAVGDDTDSDGMIDSWETYYFGGTDAENGDPEDDWDGDGSSNLSEAVAGTDPTDRDSTFSSAISDISASSLNISWSSVEGKTYQLYRSTSLAEDSWEPVGIEIEATPPSNSYDLDLENEESAFYKIVVE